MIKKTGFGLVEVLVSIVILTTVITALSYLANYMIRSANTASHKTEALGYAQGIVEELKNEFRRDGELTVVTTDCRSSNPTCPGNKWGDPEKTAQDNVKFNLFYDVSRELPNQGGVATPSESDNYYRLDSKVTWDERGKTRQVHLTTYLGKVR